jgi:hypothetical protein
MSTVRRSPVNKRASARSFRKNVSRTARLNVAPNTTRGGYRL